MFFKSLNRQNSTYYNRQSSLNERAMGLLWKLEATGTVQDVKRFDRPTMNIKTKKPT